MTRNNKKFLSIEFTMELEDHIPIRILAEGSSLEELLSDAKYNVEVPDPVNYYPIENMRSANFDFVREEIERQWLAR